MIASVSRQRQWCVAATMVVGWLIAPLATAQQEGPDLSCPPIPDALLVEPGWPVEPTHQEHHVAALLEYIEKGTFGYIHDGMDVLAIPCETEGTLCDAPFVVTTVGGDCQWFVHKIVVKSGDLVHTYGHIRNVPPDIESACQAGCPIGPGTKIAQVDPWPVPDYSHLHYGVRNDVQGTFNNPLRWLTPVEDNEPPKVWPPRFYKNEPDACEASRRLEKAWLMLSGGCEKVVGDVDIVVRVDDHYRAGHDPQIADALGPRLVRYRICGEHEPDCDDWIATHDFESMPKTWKREQDTTSCILHSALEPVRSRSLVFQENQFYIVVTNFDESGSPSAEAAWKTSEDGFYSITIEATDFAGNSTRRTDPICVNNADACPGKVVIRDCRSEDDSEDRGGEPSPCDPVDSPDITILERDDGKVFVAVCALNLGCKPIPESMSMTAEFSLREATAPLSTEASPLQEWSKTKTVSDLVGIGGADLPGPWVIGQQRCLLLPVKNSVLESSHHTVSVYGSVSVGDDVPNFDTRPRYDNNKSEAILSLPTSRGD